MFPPLVAWASEGCSPFVHLYMFISQDRVCFCIADFGCFGSFCDVASIVLMVISLVNTELDSTRSSRSWKDLCRTWNSKRMEVARPSFSDHVLVGCARDILSWITKVFRTLLSRTVLKSKWKQVVAKSTGHEMPPRLEVSERTNSWVHSDISLLDVRHWALKHAMFSATADHQSLCEWCQVSEGAQKPELKGSSQRNPSSSLGGVVSGCQATWMVLLRLQQVWTPHCSAGCLVHWRCRCVA